MIRRPLALRSCDLATRLISATMARHSQHRDYEPSLVRRLRSIWADSAAQGRVTRRSRAKWALRIAADRVLDFAYDCWYSVDTQPADDDPVEAAEVDRHKYTPTPYRMARSIVDDLLLDKDAVFLDIGCGKGRLLVEVALRWQIKRVSGVEYDARLSAIATDNLQVLHKAGRLRTTDVEVINADARSYEIADDVTVVFLYDPFLGSTFRAVVDNITQSLQRRPRPLSIVYLAARSQDVLLARGFEIDRSDDKVVVFTIPMSFNAAGK